MLDNHRTITVAIIFLIMIMIMAWRFQIKGQPEFVSDGCSMFPDGNWRHCCETHDQSYWRGGPASARLAADKALAACVGETIHPALGQIMYLGVRLGGNPWLPFDFRWGFGQPWPATYAMEIAHEEEAKGAETTEAETTEAVEKTGNAEAP